MGFEYSDGPAPSAPPMQGEVGYGQQPVVLTPIEKAVQLGQAAVGADQKGDWDGALKLYEKAVAALQAVMRQQTTQQGVDKVQAYVTSYNDRIDGIRRNKRRIKASQATPTTSTPPPTMVPTPASSKQASGWDGTDFSGRRRGTFDKALHLIDQAKTSDLRGDLLKAKAAYEEAIGLLIDLIKTEKNVDTMQLLNSKAKEFMTRAEVLNTRIAQLGIKPPKS